MRCSLKNKSLTKQKKRGRLLIHIPGAWSYPSKKQVTPTHSVNVCMFYLEILCDQALECSVNSKRYILPSMSHRHPALWESAEACAVYDDWAILVAKLQKNNRNQNRLSQIYTLFNRNDRKGGGVSSRIDIAMFLRFICRFSGFETDNGYLCLNFGEFFTNY
ncbi:MAG: hypothetical protein II886_05205 [Prevotella sp.]|nr:hypothetical protein [Prevotella sp.]